MRAFVTVGSTQFDSLVETVLLPDTLQTLYSKGYTELVVQCGNSKLELFPHDVSERRYTSDGVQIYIWRFKPSLKDDLRKSDLVIGHAGSGTILEVLRARKALIAVSNPSLLHNHQQELAEALQSQSFLVAATVQSLSSAIETLDAHQMSIFPAQDGSKFQKLLDEEMGYT